MGILPLSFSEFFEIHGSKIIELGKLMPYILQFTDYLHFVYMHICIVVIE